MERGVMGTGSARASWGALALTLLGGCAVGPPPVDLLGPDAAMPRMVDDLAPPPPADLYSPPPPDDLGAGFGRLRFQILDDDTHALVPARVLFRPPPGAGFADSFGEPNLFSPGSNTGALVSEGVVGSTEGVLLAHGDGTVPVPAGTYSLVVTRGPEYELVERTVTVQAGEEVPVDATLVRSVDTRGWLAADMHVHTSRSFDSRLVPERRVISMVTNGVELVVSTDHNVSTDLAPYAVALGYGGDLVGTLIGDEFNFKEGHGGAYPVPYDPARSNGGAPQYQNLVDGSCPLPVLGINCVTASVAFPIMHAQIPGTTVVTVNHPFWPNGDLGYFTNIDWGAGTGTPLPARLVTAGLFDALELLNGYQSYALPEHNLLADWFYLLDEGYEVTALGSSDTHKINWVRPGWPRTWLRLPNDRPGDTTGELFADAIRHQRAIASTGPFITLTVDGAQIGDHTSPTIPGQVTVVVVVDAPPWIDLDQVKVYVNGVARVNAFVHDGRRPRFAGTFVLPLHTDAWIVAQVSGDDPLPADIVGESGAYAGFPMKPWAVTNPIYVDANLDGVWTPPPFPPRRRRDAEPPPDPAPLPPADACGMGEPPLDTPEHVVMPLLY